MKDAADAEVVVVGAGLAGLSAADELTRARVSTMVIEARDRPGGRVRATGGLQLGGEFVGRPHRRLRALITRLGLRTRPASRTGPILWRTRDGPRLSRLPPVPAAEVTGAVRALARIRRDALALDKERPWTSPDAARLDTVSAADYLQATGAGPATRELLDALISSFATFNAAELSALQMAWWIGRAGGLTAALASGTGSQITTGADTLPARYADAITAPISYRTALTAIETRNYDTAGGTDDRPVQLTTTAGPLRAKAAVLAIPLPALRRIAITPPLPEPLNAAMNDLRFGTATKISARVVAGHPIRPRAAVGGSPLGIAWRTGQVISGITAETGHDCHLLLDDLLTVFDTPQDAVHAWADHDWTADPWSSGSYIAFAPGRLTRHGAALRTPHGRLAFAAAERSSWPNSIEGALESGHAAATRVHALLATT